MQYRDQPSLQSILSTRAKNTTPKIVVEFKENTCKEFLEKLSKHDLEVVNMTKELSEEL